MQESVIVARALGAALGSFLGYHVGVWRAAARAAEATYKTQQGLR